jgi:CRP-like cAMP-binding protein
LRAVESRLKKNEILKAEFSNNIDGINKFFDDMSSLEELKKLSKDRRMKTFKKKEIIFNEGNIPNYLYFLSKGKVKTHQNHEYGKEFITNLYKEGDFFGYIALLEEKPFNETAEALEDSEVLLIPKDDFYSLVYTNTHVMKKFIKMLSDNIIEKENMLVNLAYSSVRKRVANALVVLSDRYNDGSNSKFNISFSREDLANIVGTATESLIRTLSDFKDEKYLEVKGSNITILNYDKLKSLKA